MKSVFGFILIFFIIFNITVARLHHGRKSTCPVNKRCPVHNHKICGSDGILYSSHCHLRKAGCERGLPLRPVHPDQCNDEDGEFGSPSGKTLPHLPSPSSSSQSPHSTDERTIDLAEEEEDEEGTHPGRMSMIAPTVISQVEVEAGKRDWAPHHSALSSTHTGSHNKESSSSLNQYTDRKGASSVVEPEEQEAEAVAAEKEEVTAQKEEREDHKEGPPSEDDPLDRETSDSDTNSQSCGPKQYDSMKEQLLLKTNDVSLLFTQLDENLDGSININELWKKSGIFKVSVSACLITDLLQHEDKNQDDSLDFQEFQTAFANLYTITMVTLDQNLAVNYVQAQTGQNVEIRCDIVGLPRPPVIIWSRFNVNLAPVNVPNMKVFSDGSLYLTDVQLSFSGNYTCQAETNSAIKQVHVLSVIVAPVVEVTPHFLWAPPNGAATMECLYENLHPSSLIEWLKNDELITSNLRTAITNNGTRLQLTDLTRSDTGAYACRIRNHDDTAMSQDVCSLLVQTEPIAPSHEPDHQRMWLFHGNGVTIYSEGCKGMLHEMNGRDVVPLNGLPLCGRSESDSRLCEWGPDPVFLDGHVYVAQPNMNRVVVFHGKQLNVVQLIATDPQPRELTVVHGSTEHRIWVLCHGQSMEDKKRQDLTYRRRNHDSDMEDSMSRYEDMIQDPEYQWNSPSKEQQRHNRKTVQIIRLPSTASQRSVKQDNELSSSTQSLTHGQNVIHLQPIDGHFDLVYDLFVPTPSRLLQAHNLFGNSRYAYVSHWDERAMVKVDMEQFKYLKTVNLAECQPISVVFTDMGLVIIQCQTPVTHQLNGQMIVDQLTDAIVSFNPHIRGHQSFLSPNQRFLVNIFQNESATGITSTTVIVQQVSQEGVTFLYDVRTTLNIVNCDFVWKNGNYDAILASGTSNREDLLYLSLIDGRVELISGIGRPTGGSHRGLAVSNRSRLGAVTSLESVFVVDLSGNRVQCESPQKHQNPTSLLWT